MLVGFVVEVEIEGFAVKDIRPRHEIGCTCEVGGYAIVFGDTADIG